MIVGVVIFVLILDNLGMITMTLETGKGVGSFALTLALHNILADLVASFSIMIDKVVNPEFIVYRKMCQAIYIRIQVFAAEVLFMQLKRIQSVGMVSVNPT